MNKKKHFHFIGIGGTAMASLARAFSLAGFKVTGSDVSHIFPPMSHYLKKNKIKYYTPFSDKKLCSLISEKNTGSLASTRASSGFRMTNVEIIIGNAHVSNENPEVKWAWANKIPISHFPKLLEKYLIKKNSVVGAGTYAKTTMIAMIAWLFEKCGKNPNYMLGGIPLNFNHGARLTRSNWSVVEGDEYPAASPWDYSPKFKFYHPKYLILSSAEWDHADIFKTRASYVKVFRDLVHSMSPGGLIVAKLGGENLEEVLKEAGCRVVYYSQKAQKTHKAQKHKNKKFIYWVDEIKTERGLTTFSLKRNNKLISWFNTTLIGDFNLENWCGAIALVCELKLPIRKIRAAVKSFKGVKRRLEVRAVKNRITVIDDFAHNPSKARESIRALVKHFSNSRIFIVFEPNRGGRSKKCLKKYNHAFDGVYKIIIPKLSEYKKKKDVVDMSGKELADYLKKTYRQVIYQPNNKKILSSLLRQIHSGDVIAFLGSRDFGGMIEEVISNL